MLKEARYGLRKTAVPFPVLIKGWLFPPGSDTGTCLTAFVARPGGEVGGVFQVTVLGSGL